jgi:CheY-like chemotaxis protein
MAKLILVVEDESAVRELMVLLIDNENDLNATGAGSGFQALELLRTINFDLITLDLNMPEIDGNTFLTELKNVAPLTPVIVVSATPQNLISHSQVKAVVPKPFNIEQLMEVIKKFSG